MFAIGFTLFVAVLAATLWALRSFLFGGPAAQNSVPHDPTTFELAAMAAITVATYTWMKRLQWLRERAAPTPQDVLERLTETPLPTRYAETLAEIRAEEQRAEEAEHVA